MTRISWFLTDPYILYLYLDRVLFGVGQNLCKNSGIDTDYKVESIKRFNQIQSIPLFFGADTKSLNKFLLEMMNMFGNLNTFWLTFVQNKL